MQKFDIQFDTHFWSVACNVKRLDVSAGKIGREVRFRPTVSQCGFRVCKFKKKNKCGTAFGDEKSTKVQLSI